ncbi:lysine-specific histone demethylase [Acrasis kona]|uniref:Lysine-specific histone demethylase n=1 Tax=Acrasis kona TaxID=1008807 RepID=A0AAW2YMX8_9EUKA
MGLKHDYILCEASNRLGGRVRTNSHGVELGAEFIHGDNSLLSKLVDQLNIKKKLAFDVETGEGIQYYHNKKFLNHEDKVIQNLHNVIDSMLDESKLSTTNDMSCREYLEVNNMGPEVASLLDSRLMRTNGTNLDSQSILGHTLENESWTFGCRNYQLCKGHSMTQVMEHLSKPLQRVLLNQTIHTIDYTNEKHIVINDGFITCDYVIVTVPISILHRRHEPYGIKFTPSLPQDTQYAIDHMLGMDSGMKVHLMYKKPIWHEQTTNKGKNLIFVSDHSNIAQIWFPGAHTTSDGLFIINGFTTGDKSSSAVKNQVSDHHIIQEFRQLVSEMYNVPMHQDGFVKGKVFDWRRDCPTVFGAYSFSKVAKGRRWDAEHHPRNVLSKSVDNRIYFAGEGTSLHAYSTIQGGLESGERAAKQVLADMQEKNVQPIKQKL